MTTPTPPVTPPDGGPAFPPADYTWDTKTSEWRGKGPSGMSLRDWFAGQALSMIVINDTSGRPENYMQHYAESAYRYADAMIAARGGTQ